MREHLEQVPLDRLSVEDRALLTPRETPPAVRFMWPIFCEIAMTRRQGLGGPEALGFDQVLYWQALTGRTLMPWQRMAIYRVDASWRAHVAANKPTPKAESKRGH